MLARSQRIRTDYEFRKIRGRGSRFESASFFAFILPSRQDYSRLGVIVSAKIGISTKRKRAARVLRAGFREAQPALAGPLDVVLIARPVVLKKKSPAVAEELKRLGRWAKHR